MPQEKRIWLHIGLPKCGSTSIQGYFADHDAHYLRHGLCYPKTGRSTSGYRSHHPLAGTDIADLPAIVDTLAEEAKEARDILISCEEYTTRLSPKALALGRGRALVTELRRAFPGSAVTVVAYFRNIYEFIESCYAQFILDGLFQVHQDRFFSQEKPRLQKFVAQFEKVQGFKIYSIRQFTDAIKAAFPDTDLQLRSIEKADLGGTGMIEDLCAVMGHTPLPMTQRRNARDSNRNIAAAHLLRTRLDNDAFMQVRRPLRRLDLDGLADDPEVPFRTPAICIGGRLHDVIKAQVEAEKDALPALFDTPMTALIEDRWTPLVPGSRLTPAMRKKVMGLVRRKIGKDLRAS